jgi:hypothetical protein
MMPPADEPAVEISEEEELSEELESLPKEDEEDSEKEEEENEESESDSDDGSDEEDAEDKQSEPGKEVAAPSVENSGELRLNRPADEHDNEKIVLVAEAWNRKKRQPFPFGAVRREGDRFFDASGKELF